MDDLKQEFHKNPLHLSESGGVFSNTGDGVVNYGGTPFYHKSPVTPINMHGGILCFAVPTKAQC